MAKAPGDASILATAYRDGRVLVTLDKDFGELAVLHEQRHAGTIRLVNLAAASQASTCIRILNRYESELSAGAIETVSPDRIRIRSPLV